MSSNPEDASFATGGFTGNTPGDTIKVILDNGYVVPKADVARGIEILNAPNPLVVRSKPTPTIGRIVHYTLGPQDADAINRRRADSLAAQQGFSSKSNGAQRHIGNSVHSGDVFPMLIVRVWPTSVNGQVFLDGNDTFWALSVSEGEGERHYQWPNVPSKTEASK